MIQNDDHFAVVLADADRRLAGRPSEGTSEHAEFLGLLRDIAAYRPAIHADPPPGFEEQRKQLAEHLKAFEARLQPHYGPHWHGMVGGDLRPGRPALA